MSTQLPCVIVIDILTRVSLVLMAGLLLALTARRNAALQHAILVAALALAFLVPAAMLSVEVLPVPRWRFEWPSQVGREGVVNSAGTRPLGELRHRTASHDLPAPEIVSTRREGARPNPGHEVSAQADESSLVPRALSRLISHYGQLILSGLLWAFLFGAIVNGIGFGFSLVRLRRIVARARPVAGDEIRSLLGLIQRRIPLRQPLRLLESEEVSAPVAAGIIGNYVLLPTGLAGGSCHDEILAVLCHETAHLARRDHRVLILQELLASALWFHPLVHLFNRMLNRAREEVCDNHAIALVDRVSYCEALLLLAAGPPGPSLSGATSMWSRHWSLEDRVRGILDEQRPTRTRISGVARSATATFSVAVCGLMALPQLAASSAKDPIATAAPADSSRRGNAGPAANEMTRSILKSFPANQEKMLRFENLAGRVELVPGNGPKVEVSAIVRVSELAKEDVKRLIDDIRWVEAATEDGESRWGLAMPEGRYPTVRYAVSGESPPGVTTVNHLGQEIRLSDRPGESIPAVEFDLRIAIPPKARVAIHNAVGPIGGADLAAPLQATTYAGSIQLRNLRAPVTATSDRGPIMIENLDSDALLRTGSGVIELTRVVGGRVDLTTGSGDCRIIQPRDTAFALRYVGKRPVVVFANDISRNSLRSGNQHTELLSRGSGGPVITVNAGTGDCVIESSP